VSSAVHLDLATLCGRPFVGHAECLALPEDGRCTGIGTVTKDGLPIGQAYYVYEVYRKVPIRGSAAARAVADPAATRVRIRLRAPTFPRTRLALAKSVVTLHLEDGRTATGVLKGNALVLHDVNS
jgi:hypothetical protein